MKKLLILSILFCFAIAEDEFFEPTTSLGGYGELVTKREEIGPALQRAMKSGKTACINVKCKGVISPIVAATSDKRDKASIE